MAEIYEAPQIEQVNTADDPAITCAMITSDGQAPQ